MRDRDASGKSIFSLMRASTTSNNNNNTSQTYRIDTSPSSRAQNSLTHKRTKSLTTDSLATIFNMTVGRDNNTNLNDPSLPSYCSSPNSPVGLRHSHLTFDDATTTTSVIDLSVQKQPLRRSRGIFGSAKIKSRSNSTSSKVPIALFANTVGAHAGFESSETGLAGETSVHPPLPPSETGDGTESNLQRRGSAISLGHTMRYVTVACNLYSFHILTSDLILSFSLVIELIEILCRCSAVARQRQQTAVLLMTPTDMLMLRH